MSAFAIKHKGGGKAIPPPQATIKNAVKLEGYGMLAFPQRRKQRGKTARHHRANKSFSGKRGASFQLPSYLLILVYLRYSRSVNPHSDCRQQDCFYYIYANVSIDMRSFVAAKFIITIFYKKFRPIPGIYLY